MAEPLVVANPNAKGGRGGRVLSPLENALRAAGHHPVFHPTRAPGHAREIVADLVTRQDPAPLLVVGGDGTLHEVANGLRDAGLPPGFPLVVLPVGTGNDFHRMLRSTGGIEEAVALLTQGVPRALDLGEARWEGGSAAFVNLLGVGIDVAVLRRRAAFARLPGLLQYGGALLSALRHFTPPEVDIVTAPGAPDEEDLFRGRALLAAVTVGPSIGGGFMLSPRALPDDGLLDLFLAEPLSFLQVLGHLPGVVRGTLETTDRIHRATFPAARFASDPSLPMAFELDGELMPQTTAWLDMRILPGALTLLDLP